MSTARTALIGLLLLLVTADVSAARLRVEFLDPAGDQSTNSSVPQPIDLLGMRLEFDDSNGAFSVTFVTSTAHPLFGSFELNANLVNGELPFPRESLPYGDMKNLFIFNRNEIVLEAPATAYTLNGSDEHLTHWHLGDRIGVDTCTFSDACGNYSLVTSIQGGIHSPFLFDFFGFDRDNIARLEAAPVPLSSGAPFLTVALLGLAAWAAPGRRRAVTSTNSV